MSRLAGRRHHHTVTDGQSEEEVGDVGELQAAWSPRGTVAQRLHRRTKPAQLPHQLGVRHHLLRLNTQMQGQQSSSIMAGA